MSNPIIDEINKWLALGLHPKQQAYFEELARVAICVKTVSINEVFSPEEIKIIRRVVKPERKQCYKNAHILTQLFPERVKYVEGKVNSIIPIDHAFNKVGDKYIDITFEMALKDDPTQYEYVLFGEYDNETIESLAEETGYYGEYYRALYIKNLEKK